MKGRTGLLFSLIIAAFFCGVTAQATTECKNANVGDIVFLVDGSSSIDPVSFQDVRTFLRNVIKGFDIGATKVQIGVAQYSDEPYKEFLLKDYKDKKSLLAAVEGISQRGGGTETGKAMDFLLKEYFTKKAGSRVEQRVPQIAVVITDGESTDGVVEPARKLRQHGVIVFAIGVGDFNPEQLKSIANWPPERFLLTTTNYQKLQNRTDSLLRTVCLGLEEQIQALADRFGDIFFLVDSGIAQRQFVMFRNQLRQLVNGLKVGASSYRIGLAQYGRDVSVEFLLNAHQTKQQTLNAVQRFRLRPQPNQPRNLGRALSYAKANFFTAEAGGRADQGTPQYLVVVTGKDSDDRVSLSARQLQDTGVTIVGMNAGATMDALYRFASSGYIYDSISINQMTDILTAQREEYTKDCKRANVADIVFIVDESGSIGASNFRLMRIFLHTVISGLEIGESRVRVGIVTYNNKPTAQAYLDTFIDKKEILQFINTLPYHQGGTNTGAALNFTLNNIFIKEKGSREDVQNIAVVITDGESQDNVSEPAIALRRKGVKIYAVGVNEAKTEELVEMASHPQSKYVFSVKNFTELTPLRQTLQENLCNTIIQTTIQDTESQTDIKEACIQKDQADFFFLIDDSGSISNNDFYDMKKFIIEFLHTFRIGPQHVRIGLVKYSDSPTTEFDLTEYSDAKKMETAVEEIHHAGGGTNTGRALSYMAPLLKEAKDSRSYKVPEYLIVVTDGESQDKVKTPAEEIRAQGVIIYAIGVKESNSTQLTEIAGDPKRTFFVSNFDALKSIKNGIITDICSPEVCKDIPSDIFFLTDSSESISEKNFKTMKEFMKSVISKSIVGQNEVHIGVMQFSSTPRLEFDLNKYYNRESILKAIDDMEQMNEGTRTGRAIKEVSQYFDASRGGRPDLRQWLVVITDGAAHDDVIVPANDLRAKGVAVYAIGVDKANRTQLQEISGSLERVFIENTFDALTNLERELALKFCDPQRDCKKTDKADIIFMVDGSTSIKEEDFTSMKTFMISIVDLTTVGEDLTRFGVILYSNQPTSSFTLNAIYSKGKVVEAIQNLTQPTGDTYTGAALSYSLQYFNEEHGGRRKLKVPQILMVITDGEATDPHRLEAESDALRDHGITVFSIGVMNAKREELETMAGGDNSKVFFVDNFDELKTLYKNISIGLCNTTKKACNQTDLVFLLDYSSSITEEDHKMMINFTAEVVKNFRIGEEFVHVGLAQFSDTPRVEFFPNQYYNEEDMIRHIVKMEYAGGNTYIGRALDHIKEHFQESRGSRRGIPKNLVVITDGNSHDDVEEAADHLRAMGIEMFAIAVGDVYYLQLLQITGTPENVFSVQNFNSLANIKTKIINAVCKSEPSEEPKSDCSIDIAVGFDITDRTRPGEMLIRDHISHLEEIVHHISSVGDLCCVGTKPIETKVAFHLVDRDGGSLYDTNFEVYNKDVVNKVLTWPLSQPTYFDSALLQFFKDRFAAQSKASVKVLLIFSDGLNEDLMKLEYESELLQKSGVSALITVALRSADPAQLRMVEFGRGFGYLHPLTISMWGIGSTILQQISAVADRECCKVMCKCSGHEGIRGLPGTRGIKGEPGQKGQLGYPGEEGVMGERGLPGPSGPQGIQGCAGARGQKGYRGISGNRGEDGEDGLYGVSGEQGTSGLDGLKGDRGEPGKPGIPGVRGEPGQKGQRGLRGDPGTPGVDNTSPGPKGDPGTQGRPGDPGPDGQAGEDGINGNLGPDGRRGLSGDKGSPGVKGARGPPGVPGPAGPQGRGGNEGEPGPKGTSGFPGPQGQHGSAGDPGLAGRRGPNGQKGQPGDPGVKGNPGPLGPRGTPGLDGRDGFGFEGPKGAKGDSGYPGYPGLPGEEGLKGQTGYPGPKGNRGRGGNSGTSGESGVPGDPGHPGHKGPKGPPGSRAMKECQLINYIRENCACSQGQSACPAHPTELVFGLDMSDDVTPASFERQRSALLHLLEDISIAESNCPNGARVAVVAFNTYTKYLIRFQDYRRKRQLTEAVRNIALERTSNKRYLGATMRFVGQNIFKRFRAGFSMRKVAVFFINGPSQDDDDLVAAIMEYRALNIFPAVISLRNVPGISRVMSVDDTGYSIAAELRRQQDQAADLRTVKNCAVCYDPCKDSEECAFIQDDLKPLQANVDLVMVLDSSREMQADEYAGAQQLLSSVMEQLAVSPRPRQPGTLARVGVVQQNGTQATKVEFGLQTYQNVNVMKTHLIQKMQQQGGSSALGQTLDYTLKEVLLKAGQPRRKKALLTVVGTTVDYRDQAKLHYISQKAKCEGVALFVVAVGDGYNRTQVEELASVPIKRHLIYTSRLTAEEQGYAQRFIRVFLSALNKEVITYSPPSRQTCSQLSEPEETLHFINGQDSADWELEVSDQAEHWFQEQAGATTERWRFIKAVNRGDDQSSLSGAERNDLNFTPREQLDGSVSKDACLLNRDPGNCQDYSIKWFFNHKESICARFWYGGCGGNKNRFETLEECRSLCLTTCQ